MVKEFLTVHPFHLSLHFTKYHFYGLEYYDIMCSVGLYKTIYTGHIIYNIYINILAYFACSISVFKLYAKEYNKNATLTVFHLC